MLFRSLVFSFFRADDLAAVLLAILPAALRAGDFLCAAMRLAAREVGFFLAIEVLPFRYEERVAQNHALVGGPRCACTAPIA